MTLLREYSVCLHDYEGLEEFYNDMETPGGSLYIPDRAVELTSRRPISRQTYYRLTEEEAVLIRQDSRVKFVDLTPEEAGIKFTLSVTQTSSNWNKSKTINNQQRNWGLLASTTSTNLTGWGTDITPTVSGSATWTPTGANVDVVIADGHILSSHPEFDSRFVPYNWYRDTPAVTGEDASTYSYSDATYNYHATHVAGIAAGNTHGWARSANIYNISIFQVATSQLFDYVRYWHANKAVNGSTGRRNPTVLNCSFETAYAGGVLQSASSISSVTYRGTTYSGPFSQSTLQGYGFVFNADGNFTLPVQNDVITQDIWDTLAAGVIVVNAAGNTWQKIDVPGGADYNNTCEVGGDTIYYNRGSALAGMDGTYRSISVGGVSDKSAELKLSISASGPRVDIFAPAESINSSWPNAENPYNDSNWYAYEPSLPVLDPRGGGYIMKLSGTSMASPQVTGVVAALLETNWTWTPAQALNHLTTNAVTGRIPTSAPSGSPLSHKASLAQYNLNGANNRYLYLSSSPPPPPVPPAPVANFSANFTSGAAPLTVNFTDLSTNSPTSWAWDIDNSGTTDYTTQNPSHTFLSSGTYSVKLTASNSSGSDEEVKTNYIVVSTLPPVPPAPVANFSANFTSGAAPLTVNFTDLSTNSPTSWAWDIDNSGTTDYTTQNPSHTFLSSGTYSVKLTASNSSGSDEEVKTNYIVVSTLPPVPVANTGYIAQAPDYNYSQALAKDVIGLGINGWGQGSQNSNPVTTRNKITRAQWLNLSRDVNFIQKHITGTVTTTGLVPSTGTVIAAAIPNAVGALVDSLVANRYVCHPTQFFGYPGPVINSQNGISISLPVWGREISHQIRIDWPTNLFARYFFNAGSVFTWTPSYASIADTNDRDAEWVTFIDYLKAGSPYEYVRDDFLAVPSTKTTVYNSGSLSVTIIALRNGTTSTATRVDFTAIFRNEDLPYLVVDPVRGYWNYGPWETL